METFFGGKAVSSCQGESSRKPIHRKNAGAIASPWQVLHNLLAELDIDCGEICPKMPVQEAEEGLEELPFLLRIGAGADLRKDDPSHALGNLDPAGICRVGPPGVILLLFPDTAEGAPCFAPMQEFSSHQSTVEIEACFGHNLELLHLRILPGQDESG
jgi:hypothetical protein